MLSASLLSYGADNGPPSSKQQLEATHLHRYHPGVPRGSIGSMRA